MFKAKPKEELFNKNLTFFFTSKTTLELTSCEFKGNESEK